MMNLYRPNNTGRRRLWAATLLVVFLFFVDLLSGGRVRAALQAGAATVSKVFGGIGTSISSTGFFSSRAGLAAQNRALSQQLDQYQERAAAFAVLEAENEQLRALTHVATLAPGITAPVVSSVISSPYGTFLIGAGSADGVVQGNLVLTDGGFVVGKVSTVGAHVSTVTEVFAPGSSLDVIMHGTSAALSGSGGGNAHASVPRGVDIEQGDPVVAPEFGERAVGMVGAVASSSARATQDIYISLPVGLGSLQFVYVVSL